jgi:prepilin-type N-terminal cleavage/methylation domain-containing protein
MQKLLSGQQLKKKSYGFSFIEMVTVLAVLLILSFFSLPAMELSFVKTREKLLHERLTEIRNGIDRYVASRKFEGGHKYPSCLASLTEKIPNDLLLPGANPGPFLDSSSFGNPFTDGGESFLWDIRDPSGNWHLDLTDPEANTGVFDVRYPVNGVQGWKVALDETIYADW